MTYPCVSNALLTMPSPTAVSDFVAKTQDPKEVLGAAHVLFSTLGMERINVVCGSLVDEVKDVWFDVKSLTHDNKSVLAGAANLFTKTRRIKQAQKALADITQRLRGHEWDQVVKSFTDPVRVVERVGGVKLADDKKAKPIRQAVERIIDELPAFLYSAKLAAQSGIVKPIITPVNTISGKVHHPRFEAMLHLFAGVNGTQGMRVVENGPGNLPMITHVLLKSGCLVVVKEPSWGDYHHKWLLRDADRELLTGLEYALGAQEIKQSTPGRVVIWENPNKFTGNHDKTWGAYMGRDVEVGGYLMVQADIEKIKNALDNDFQDEFRAKRWEKIYASEIPYLGAGLLGYVTPTAQMLFSLKQQYFYVYRRLA